MTRRLRELALWAGSALGLLAVAAGLAVAFLGFDLLVFRSGSMSPAIPTGGLAVAHSVPAAELGKGDVVSVTTATGDRVTHRVVSSTLRGDEASLILQGDANDTPDEEVYQVTSVDRVIASVPWGGYVLVHAMTPPGLVAAGALGLMLVVLGFGPSPAPRVAASGSASPVRPARRAPHHRQRRTRRNQLVLTGMVSVLVTCAVVGAGGGVTKTWARFTDTGTARTGTFSTGTVKPPTSVRCSAASSPRATVSWAAPTAQNVTGYRIAYSVDGTPNATTFDVASASTTITFTFQAPALLNGAVIYTFTVSTLASPWESEMSATSATVRVTRSALGNAITECR